MKIFLDTSSLFKLYHTETGSEELENFFSINTVTQIYLSEITKIEFSSTIWKKVRTKEITEEQAKLTLKFFEDDFGKYNFITSNTLVLEQARVLVSKYGTEGLRTLDSIQLSTCVSLNNTVDVFFTEDKILKTLIVLEGLNTEIINR